MNGLFQEYIVKGNADICVRDWIDICGFKNKYHKNTVYLYSNITFYNHQEICILLLPSVK